MFEKEAKERAKKLEENQTLGVYDNEEDYERDRGWNKGEVCGYEEGFKDGAEFGYNKCKKEIEKDGVVPQLYMDETIRQNLALKREIEKLKKSK